jgi:hypothetical protein
MRYGTKLILEEYEMRKKNTKGYKSRKAIKSRDFKGKSQLIFGKVNFLDLIIQQESKNSFLL